MKPFFKYTILLLALLASTNVKAQEIWSLDKCIQYAKEHNLQIRESTLNVEQARNNLTQAKYSFLPNLSAGINESLSWGRSVDLQSLQIIKHKLRSSTSASLSSSVTVFDGLSNVYNLKSSKKQL